MKNKHSGGMQYQQKNEVVKKRPLCSAKKNYMGEKGTPLLCKIKNKFVEFAVKPLPLADLHLPVQVLPVIRKDGIVLLVHQR